jgi:hypothetical protein
VTAIAAVLDDTLQDGPVGEILIFSFFLGFDNVTREVTSNVLHTLIPRSFTLKDSATEAAGAALWGFALLHPAAGANLLQTVLESSPILVSGIARCNGA